MASVRAEFHERGRPAAPAPMVRARITGHLGEFLQGRIGRAGPVALITLPCPALAVAARAWPAPALSLSDAAAGLIPPGAARAVLSRLGRPLAAHVTMRADMPAGGGAGASTAALMALAHLAGAGRLPPDRLARACLAAEGASDPLMHPAPARLLWASRAGRIVRRLPPPPAFEVVGGFLGPPRATDPSETDFPDIADLIAPWAAAAACGDHTRLAALAGESAARRLGPALAGDPTPALARRTGAPGWAIGHTGPARALLFAPGAAPAGAEAALTEAGLTGVLRFRTEGA